MSIRLSIVIGSLLLSTVSTAAWGEIRGKEVEYTSDGTMLKGYLVENTAIKGKRPAVLVVHEWWGHNDYARNRAKMLAKLGYTALAVDMFGNGKTAQHPDDAAKFAGELMKNKELSESRFNAAVEFVKQQKSVDPTKIAAIGYCFGGGVVLHMARQGADLKGIVSFHGSLATDSPAAPGAVKARVLVFNGEADKMITAEQVTAFKNEMDLAGANYRYVGYPGVMHSFTNPAADDYAKRFNLPLAYNKNADKDSWGQTVKFLKDTFNLKI
ncbi:dienelactone hydrolase family protein [Geobacter pelophilus]|uniref:Dienelactone hydrolase family protein n=1 Tax=Geoanaerobacter pelophilus TaxID=60036 RepID=A0AAW4LF01_9BACT|nr:dienelactone hydrolase family protein [Geoanaerobacter pelophilus]MBT0666579.1 dienelactone hydrolase family protein [Geoanaerobacter pelophilus]